MRKRPALMLFAFLLTESRAGATIDYVPCDYPSKSCRCDSSATACEFDLNIDYLQTFTRYPLSGTDIQYLSGFIHYINESGEVVSYDGNSYEDGYIEAATVDGKTYRPFITVNGRSPGPTLIVTEDQTVIANVKNNIRGQSITIHWHGQLQLNTPWMDGVGFITQCPVTSGGTFRYIFKAQPSGTFWYHSHIEGQRGDGLLGALIVLEKQPDTTYLDIPEQHTIVLQDWWPQPFFDLFTVMHSAEEVYYPSAVGELPTEIYTISTLPDGSGHGALPFFSGLINGKGRHSDVPYERSKLATFQVEYGQRYRFRVVAGQALFGYKISIDQHKISVISTDGFLIQPVVNVDYLILFSGERYDFVLTADQNPTKYYWIEVETLEVNTTAYGPPYPSLGNSVQAVLFYSNMSEPSSNDYSAIDTTSSRSCTQSAPCVAVNCPFQAFHESYNTSCVNVGDLQLLNPTPPESLPSNDPSYGQEYFLNFGYSGLQDQLPDNINGRSFMMPPETLQLQSLYNPINLSRLACPTEPYSCSDGCSCLQMLSIPYNNTVRLVLANLGQESHAIHLHGHSYFVAAVGYGGYDSSSGIVTSSNRSLSCQADEKDSSDLGLQQLCTTLHWRNGSRPAVKMSPYTLRKDTIIVPSGAYVIIQFVSSSPGYWFLHCHLDPHHLEGMAMVFNIAEELQNPAPLGMYSCGDFDWSLDEYYSKLEYSLTSAASPKPSTTSTNPNSTTSNLYCTCIGQRQLAAVATLSVLGAMVIILLPWMACITTCTMMRKRINNPKGETSPQVKLTVEFANTGTTQ